MLELPLVCLLYAASRSLLRPSPASSVIAALPVFLLYIAHDLFQIALATPPQLGDMLRLPDLWRGAGSAGRVAVTAILGVPLGLWLWRVDGRALLTPWRERFRLLPLLVAVMFVGSVYVAPGWLAAAALHLPAHMGSRSERNTRYFGRLFTVLDVESQRQALLVSLAEAPAIEATALHLDEALLQQIQPRNVHVSVMESYFDPRRLRNAQFSEPPIGPTHLAHFAPFESTALSPAFGGGTGRAEFEVLCGVPSLRVAFADEFSAFTGAAVDCLPRLLARRGYLAVNTFPGSSAYYNSHKAYRGAGFAESVYAAGDPAVRTFAVSMQKAYREHLFDGDLFEQNRAHLRSRNMGGRPIFNYVLTMYGHMPFYIDEQRQPLRVAVSPDDAVLRLVANQTYYRTEALAEHLRALIADDPQSLIVVVGDHLPTGLPYDDLGLEHGRYATTLLVIDRGVPIKLGPLPHYDLYRVILDRLTDGAYCRAKPCRFATQRDADTDRATFLAEYLAVIRAAAAPNP